MVLYHGTKDADIKEFRLKNRKNARLDFGRGVYFTSHFEQAKEWACRYETPGVVYECDVDLSNLTTLSFNDPDNEDIYYVLYLCRIGLEEIAPDAVDGFDDADIIYGYMLDGCMRDFEKYAELFNEGELSFEDFKKEIKLHGIDYNQYCFKSKYAIKLLNDGIQRAYLVEKRGKEYIITETRDIS